MLDKQSSDLRTSSSSVFELAKDFIRYPSFACRARALEARANSRQEAVLTITDVLLSTFAMEGEERAWRGFLKFEIREIQAS